MNGRAAAAWDSQRHKAPPFVRDRSTDSVFLSSRLSCQVTSLQCRSGLPPPPGALQTEGAPPKCLLLGSSSCSNQTAVLSFTLPASRHGPPTLRIFTTATCLSSPSRCLRPRRSIASNPSRPSPLSQLRGSPAHHPPALRSPPHRVSFASPSLPPSSRLSAPCPPLPLHPAGSSAASNSSPPRFDFSPAILRRGHRIPLPSLPSAPHCFTPLAGCGGAAGSRGQFQSQLLPGARRRCLYR